MASDTDREKLLAEPNSEDMPLDDVVSYLVRLETAHRGLTQGLSPSANSMSASTQQKCWFCGGPGHPDNNNNKSREKHCKAYKVTCSKCDQLGHFTRCCPQCESCGAQGHRNKGYRGCPNFKKKPAKQDKSKSDDSTKRDETGTIAWQLCFVEEQAQLHCDTGQCLCSVTSGVHIPPTNAVPLPNYIFEHGNWVQRNNPRHSTVSIKFSVGSEDHRLFKHPVSDVNRLKPAVHESVVDTGCMALVVPPKVAYGLGLRSRDLIPCKVRLTGAGKRDLGTLGAFVANMSATAPGGAVVSTKQLAYVCTKVDQVYLSKTAMQDLGIVSKDFAPNPTAAACTSDSPCGCPPRDTLPPPLPTDLPPGINGSEADVPALKKWLLDRYAATAFNTCEHQPLPLMSGEPLRLHMDPEARPTAIHTSAPVPIHWHDKVKQDLDRDVRIGVLEKVPVNTPSIWCSRMVVTAKSNGEPRRTVDMQPQNRWSVRQTYPTESPFTLATRIPNHTKKTVVDAWNGYHSVPIHEEDRHVTTFMTPWGRYRYKVAPQGFLAAGDGYNQRLDSVLADITTKVRCVDDTCTWAPDVRTAFLDACALLDTCARHGVILNPDKFQFCQDVVEFAGLLVTRDSIEPSQKIIDSIQNFPEPKTISDARGWFGLVEQAAWAFTRADVMGPFRHLLRPKNKFVWTPELADLFLKSKQVIIDRIKQGVKHFELNRTTCLAPDFSGIGIGFFLLQKHCSCPGKTPTCCRIGWHLTLVGSRFLHDAETRYAPIEGECLAVAYGLHQTRYFVLGCPDLIVATDHKPLLGLLNDRSLASIENRRLLNLKEKTLAYNFKVIHVPGRLQLGADATSRHPTGAPTLLRLPGEPDPDEGNVSAALTTTETRYSIINGLMSIAHDEDDEMETCVLATCVDAINAVPFTSWDTVRLHTSDDPTI